VNDRETTAVPQALPWTKKHEVAVACCLAVLVLMLVHFHHNVRHFPFDAALYWTLGDLRSLTTVEQNIRGYFFPLILYPIRLAVDFVGGDHAITYRAVFSVLHGVLLCTVVPGLFVAAFGGTTSVVRRMIPVLLLAIIFPGVLIYPLSDLPAFLMMCGALLCLLHARKGELGRTKTWALLFASGFLSAAAYNTRTIYLFPMCIMLGAVIFWPPKSKPAARWYARAIVFGFGMLVLCLPQGVLNKQVRGGFDLAVPSAQHNGQSLFATQLAWGMELQRYETSVEGHVTTPRILYLDPAGERLVQKVRPSHVAGSIAERFANAKNYEMGLTVPEYLNWLLEHPLDFIGLYGRHAINGLDVRDGMVYTTRSSPTRDGKSLLCFAVLWLACWILFVGRLPAKHQVSRPAHWRQASAGWQIWLGLLLLPVAAIIPGAVETRFFLALHVLAYGVIAFRGDAKRLMHHLREHYVATLTVAAIAASVYFAVTLSTMANIRPV
jgi:hypothetical protein